MWTRNRTILLLLTHVREQDPNRHNTNSGKFRTRVSRGERYWRVAAQPIRKPLPALLLVPRHRGRQRRQAPEPGMEMEEEAPSRQWTTACTVQYIARSRSRYISMHGYGSPAMKPSIPPSLALSPGTSDQCCHGHGWPIELRCAAGDPVNSATDLGLIAGNNRALRVAWRLAAQLISQPRRRRSMHLSLSRACAHGDSGPGCALHAWVRIDTPLFGVGLSHFLIVIGDRVSVVTVLSW